MACAAVTAYAVGPCTVGCEFPERHAFPAFKAAYQLHGPIGGKSSIHSVFEADIWYGDRECSSSMRKRVALKRVDLSQEVSCVQAEVDAMSRLAHTNLAVLHAAFVVCSELWLALPLHRCGSCADVLACVRPRGFEDLVALLRERQSARR